ncbi:hypothetical protein OGAPHI_005199 [Ogataea philodendri]|uniref:Uncharacterized protein n=1 Tax=Ogataea philodendri TaxID=1378263 RepID=A0A9P8T2L8_9ASCO|nr:uncharacterized protein OGAPHI_005199 [Ogataea philodendri]KAH3663796.1 hypothetical protein OGAPHI_005199 [Ogataea philodendri]
MDDEELSDIEDQEYTFDFNFHFSRQVVNFDPVKIHRALYKLLRIENPITPRKFDTWPLFASLAGLCDVYTSPSEQDNDYRNVLSLRKVADSVIALNFHTYKNSNTPYFDFGYDLALIVEKISILLGCDDYTRLHDVRNDEDTWLDDLPKWTPHKTLSGVLSLANGFHDLTLLYTIASAAVYCIYLLFKHQFNPFGEFLFQLWENLSKVIMYGLEIDRRDEEQNFPGYPALIKQVVKGSAAVRAITAAVISSKDDEYVHDLQHVPIFVFMRPLGKKSITGALKDKADWTFFPERITSIDFDLPWPVILIGDKFDEDIAYMFEPRISARRKDNKHVGLNSDNYWDPGLHASYHANCPCVSQFKEQVNTIVNNVSKKTHEDHQLLEVILSVLKLVKPEDDPYPLQYDEWCTDLREMPRGKNCVMSDSFSQIFRPYAQQSDQFFESALDIIDNLDLFISTGNESVFQGSKIIRSLEWIGIYEHETGKRFRVLIPARKNDDFISTDFIVDWLNCEDNFLEILRHDHAFTYAMLDELLMAMGQRTQVFILLTTLPLNQWVVSYIHDLLTERRGEEVAQTRPADFAKYPFTRKGAVELTDHEKSVLLDLYFESLFSSLDDPASNKAGLKVVCIMITLLKKKGICLQSIHKFKIELQTWLVHNAGLGRLPEARELFFDNDDSQIPPDEPMPLEQFERDYLVEKSGPKLASLLCLIEFKNFERALLEVILFFSRHYLECREQLQFLLINSESMNILFDSELELVTIADYVFMYIHRALQLKNAKAVKDMLSWASLINTECEIDDIIKKSIESQ